MFTCAYKYGIMEIMVEDNPFRKYQYVVEYDTEQHVDEKLIRNLLQEAIFTTPSKNSMMPYRVHVIGPEDEFIRHRLYEKSRDNEDRINAKRTNVTGLSKLRRKGKKIYQYKNLYTAPYIFIFTQRLISKTNPYYQERLDKGFFYEQCADLKLSKSTALLEIGMFVHNFGMLCLKNNIDISHTRCLPAHYDEPEFDFIQNPVLLVMTAGKGKIYRRDPPHGPSYDYDYKPSFDEVVTFE